MKTRKKIVSLLLCLVLLAATLSACTTPDPASPPADGGTTTDAGTPADTSTDGNTGDATGREIVELSVMIYIVEAGDGTQVGVQTDPVSRKIEEDTGIRINLVRINTEGRDAVDVLATMMAANDLPDITWAASGTDGRINIESMVMSNQIIPLDDLIAENAPFLSTDEAWVIRLNEVRELFGVDGQLYSIPRYTEDGINPFPLNGTFVRWDLYDQASHPPMVTPEETVAALQMMVDLEPVNPDGLPNYGTGAWFADGPGWGNWVLFENAIQDRGLVRLWHTTFVDIDGQTTNVNDALYDTNSIIWHNVELYYRMNKAGLLDPDSAVQTYDQFLEKLDAGRYVYTAAGWVTLGFKPKLEAMGLPDAQWLPLAPLPDTSGAVLGWLNMINDHYVISAKCEHPDRAVQLMDYLSTDEAARMVNSGLQGETWEFSDKGFPQFRDSFLEEMSSNANGIVEQYGFRKYWRFVSAKLDSILADGEFADMMRSPRHTARTLNGAESAYLDYYNAEYIMDVFTQTDTIFIWEEALARIPEMSEELRLAQSNLDDYIYTELTRVIFAKNDAEYEQLKQAFLNGLDAFPVQEIHDHYRTEFANQVNLLRDKLTPIEGIMLERLNNFKGG